LLLAAGALALFYVFFLSAPGRDGQTAALPLSTESDPDGYQALWRWLQSQRVPVLALRNPYTWLKDRAPLAARGNLLITTLPHRVPARSAELTDLDAWIARGNTLLVMAALDDTPRWAAAADGSFLRTLRRMSRLDFEAEADQAGAPPARSAQQRALRAFERLLQPQRFEMHGAASHPLFAGVGAVLAVSGYPASRWRATPMDAGAAIEIAARRTAGPDGPRDEPLGWLEREGSGQVLIFGVASAFSNGLIAQDDNARLLSNIVAWSREGGGAVIFDDDHQGAAAYYDAHAFFGDPRLHRTILWILLAWLVFVMGTQRLRPAASAWNRTDVTTFIAVTGGFFSSLVTPAAAGRQLFHNFFNDVRRDLDLPEDGEPVWERLAADARVPAAMLTELKRLYDRSRADRSVDLVRTHNLLSLVKGTLE
jgi:hypothetical protein